MAESLKTKAVDGVLWSSINRFTTQGLGFIFNMIIARQLMPEAYGVIAMLNIFMSLSGTFIDSGFGNALMRKKDRTETDINTVYYFNLIVSILCYLVLFIASPAIARFYNMPLLEKVTKVIGITLMFNAIGGIQGTLLSIRIDFKTKTKIALICSLVSGFVGIILVYLGFGVWTLVIQQLVSSGIGCVVTCAYVRWVPKGEFSWQSFRELFSYGSKILASGFLGSIFGNLSDIVVGKVYSPSDLGEYSKSGSLAGFPANNITGVLMSVTFPVLTTIQDQPERLERYYKKIINLSAYVVFPVMIGIAAVADPLVRILLTDKWAGIIFLLQITCFDAMWSPVHAVNLNLLQVMGRSDYFLRIEILKKTISLIILAVTVPMGIVAMCYGKVVGSLIGLFINTYFTKKLIGYGFYDQLKGLMHILLHTLVMGAIAFAVVNLFDNNWVKLILGSFVGASYYVIVSKIFRFSELDDVFQIVKEKLHLEHN